MCAIFFAAYFSSSSGSGKQGSLIMPAKPARKFPALATRRLRLRAPKPVDAKAFRAIVAFPEVTRYSDWPDAASQTQTERIMRWMTKLFASGKGCAWMIEDVASGTLIGAIRFNRIERKARFGEIGYELASPFWGKGLMTEAVRAVVACGHETFRLNRIEAWTLPGNGASDRVLEKVGFRFEGTLRQRARFKGKYHDFRMFGRLADDPKS
jgi:ribosomal-protein-alanine N-acetyltransferase